MLQYLVTQKLIGIIARHVMTAAGAWLVASGYVDADADASALEAVSGGVVAAAGLIWSMVEKVARA